MSVKVTVPNTSSDSVVFGSANTPTVAEVVGIDSGSSNGQLAFKTTASGTSTERMRIDANGNVGIGTSSPTVKLDVSTSNGDTISNFKNTNASYAGDVYITYAPSGVTTSELLFSTRSTAITWIQSSYGALTFRTGTSGSASERMRIDASGNVLVGTSSFGGTQHRVVSSTTSDYQLALQATDTSTGFVTLSFYTGSTLESQIYYSKSVDRLIVTNTSAGVYLANGGTSWTSNSDERKKDIIEPIENAAEKVSTLRAVIGKYKTDEEGTRRAFLIAQDVQAVFPEAVDAANPDDLGVQYTETIPLLVAAIKELKAELDTTRSELNSVKAELNTLKGTA